MYRGSEKRIHKFGHATVTDSMGDTFLPRGLQQQTPFQSTPTLSSLPSQPQPPDLGLTISSRSNI